MTATSTLRFALSYNLLFACCALLALMVFHQSFDPYTLGYNTYLGWQVAVDQIGGWLNTHLNILQAEYGTVVSTPDNFGNALTAE